MMLPYFVASFRSQLAALASEEGRAAAGSNPVADANTAVGEIELRDAQSRDAGNPAGCAAGHGVTIGVVCGHTALHKLELFCLAG